MREQTQNRLLLINEKHDTRIFACPDEEAFCLIALKLVKERNKDYYDDLHEMKSAVLDAALKGDGKAAAKIIRSRKDCEYEGFYFGTMEKP